MNRSFESGFDIPIKFPDFPREDKYNPPTSLIIYVVPSTTEGRAAYAYSCSGASDEVVINKALLDAFNHGGGTVVLAPGVFKTEHPVVSYYSGVHLKSETPLKSIVQPSSTWTAITASGGVGVIAATIAFCGVDGFSCSGIFVDNKTNRTSGNVPNGIVAIPGPNYDTQSQNGRFSNNHVDSVDGNNYLFWSQNAKNMIINHNSCDGGYSAYVPGSDQQAFEVYGGYGVEVYGNSAKNIGGIAYLVQTIASDQATMGVSAWSCEKIRVHHNTASFCRDFLQCNTSYHATSGMAHLKEVIFDNNTADKVLRYGLHPYVGTGDTTNKPIWEGVEFHDNIVRGATAAEGGQSTAAFILAENAGGVGKTDFRSIRIYNCEGYDFAKTDTGGLIQISSFDNVWIDGCRSSQSAALPSGNGQGVLINGTTTGIKIRNNIINGARLYGISVQGSTGYEITGNEILNWNQYLGGTSAIILGTGTSNGVVARNRMKTSYTTSLGSLVNLGSTDGVDLYNNSYIGASPSGVVTYNYATATNTNRGRSTASSSTITLTSNRIRSDSIITVQRNTGTQDVTTVVPGDGTATITLASSATGTYDWAIL